MCDFKIRTMKMSEFNTVARLIYDSVHTLCVNEYTPEQLDAWVPKDLYMPSFRRSLFRTYAIVAVEGKEIIGFMSTERDGYVNRLYTHPSRVNKGVATALLENTESWAKAHGVRSLVLESSKSAEGFYRKNGFEKIGEIRSLKNDIEFISAKMKKELRNCG
ncbi:MAG: GNAT family N-acetyltransferase [Clostridia bacterium]|nr:GNAT family N-acetyltransferase [Clostridia bacterium]